MQQQTKIEILEYRIDEMAASIEQLSHTKEEILEVLHRMELQNQKRNSFVGGALFILAPVVSFVWFLAEDAIKRLFHQ